LEQINPLETVEGSLKKRVIFVGFEREVLLLEGAVGVILNDLNQTKSWKFYPLTNLKQGGFFSDLKRMSLF